MSATMAPATDTAATDEEAPAKKKGGAKKIIMIVVLLALVGFVAKGKIVKPHYSAAHQPPPGQVLALEDASGDASLTTSLADGHLVQVSIALQLTKVASLKTLTNDIPEFLNVATGVLTQDTSAALLTQAGQAQAKAQILQQIQHLAGTSEGGQEVSAVYFEGLIVQ